MMPARLAWPMFYRRVSADLDADGRLRLDALLGDPASKAELQKRRTAAIAAAGGVIR